MYFFGLFSLAFGGLIIAYPQFLAYLIGSFFLFIGINIVFMTLIVRSRSTESKSWKIGDYEIVRRRK